MPLLFMAHSLVEGHCGHVGVDVILSGRQQADGQILEAHQKKQAEGRGHVVVQHSQIGGDGEIGGLCT